MIKFSLTNDVSVFLPPSRRFKKKKDFQIRHRRIQLMHFHFVHVIDTFALRS